MQFISSWANLLRTLILLACLVIGIFYIIEGVAGDSSINLSFKGTEIRIGEKGAFKQHLVPPRGWIDSGILVKKGDVIHIKSTGSVNVSLGQMVKTLQRFTKIFRSKTRLDVSLFTDEETDSVTFNFPWNDATGIKLSDVHDVRAHQRVKTAKPKLLDPNGRLGQLIIYNYVGDGYPLLEQITELDEKYLYEGDGITIKIKENGRIYFGTNDVVLFNHKMSRLVWQDNTGFFSITTITEYKD